MLIFVEGQARTGKTTLINNLIATYNTRRSELWPKTFVTHKFDRSLDSNPMTHMLQHVLPMAFDWQHVHILDRAHITEAVYTTLSGRSVPYTAEDWETVDRTFAMSGAKMIYLVADEDDLLIRHESTRRGFEGDIMYISHLFAHKMLATRIPHVRFDSSALLTTELCSSVYGKILEWSDENA